VKLQDGTRPFSKKLPALPNDPWKQGIAVKPAQGLDTKDADNHKPPDHTAPSIHRDQILFSFLC